MFAQLPKRTVYNKTSNTTASAHWIILFSITPSVNPLIDIGANLTHESFDDDFEQVIERAIQANINHLIVTGSDVEDSEKAIAIAKKNSALFSATAGIHPHHADQYTEHTHLELDRLLQLEVVKAVGETGLDFFRDISPRSQQVESFQAHLSLAKKFNKPLFLHQRESHDTFLGVLKEHRDTLGRVVVHCFTDTAEALQDYLELDCYIGITGWICDERRGAHLLDCVGTIPLNRLMIETDAPYLMPRNLRPKPKTRRNEPCNLPVVLEAIASVRPETAEELAIATTENAIRFFSLNPAA